MLQELVLSPLVDRATQTYRVLIFDRPGYGLSPRGKACTPAEQAELIDAALRKLNVMSATVLGHSWGALVAAELALRPHSLVRRLVMVAGQYFPSRPDAVFAAMPAIPFLGTIFRHTLQPILGQLFWKKILSKRFAPMPVPSYFRMFPKSAALRPEQLKTAAVESALLIHGTKALKHHYRTIQVPTVIIAGRNDEVVSFGKQCASSPRFLAVSWF